MFTPSLRDRWIRGDVTLGAWLFLREPLTAEVAGDAGYDFVCVDMQHGVADYRDMLAIVQALGRTGATPIVRVPGNEAGVIGRVLDGGALGVVVPMVNNAEEAARAVDACRYAPTGTRSVGPIAAMVRHGASYLRDANDGVVCIPMIETVQAVDRIDEILAVPGISAAYVGPADLSMTMGLPPLADHDDPRFTDALRAVIDSCKRNGVVPGIHASAALAGKRAEQGFRMITVGFDHLPVVTALRADLATSRAAVPKSE